ncbi:hypothetical protein BDZ91DRAFT_795165 [Kalaharituber pfeilii]|nr:hypothetical protein BDZ91DRAFT_795165 [Kalaharituber pfeilii]
MSMMNETAPPATSDSHGDPASRIGLGLIEISPLATLVGAASAEALASGYKAAAGLPWAVMSVFGSLHATKAALACLVCDQVREALGLRSPYVDSSLGLNFAINLKTSARKSAEGRVATGVWIPYTGTSHTFPDPRLQAARTSNGQHVFNPTNEAIMTKDPTNHSQDVPYLSNLGSFFRLAHCAYAFDRSTTVTLATIVPSEHKEATKIYIYYRDVGELQTIKDLIAIMMSLSKLVEVIVLYKAGAEKLWWITAMSWAPCFITALTLQLAGVSRDHGEIGVIDMIAGDLPSALHPGGQGKILLGMPGNICHTLIWKVHWGIQTVSCLACVLAVFSNLAKQHIQVVYIWAAFQVIWLVVRVLICNSSWLASSGPDHAMVIGHQWSRCSPDIRRRTLELLFTLAQYQVTIHPRGYYVYQEDILSAAKLVQSWKDINWAISEFLPLKSTTSNSLCQHISRLQPKQIDIDIIGVVGDTVLRSAAWIKGLNASNVEMYDCGFVFAKVRNCDQVHCVPCCRVLARRYTPGDESIGGYFMARGSSNDHAVTWRYWIPVTIEESEHATPSPEEEHQYWVELDAGLRVVGQRHEGKLRNQDELQNYLQAGMLNISLSHAQEVLDCTNIAREATKGLREWVMSAYTI